MRAEISQEELLKIVLQYARANSTFGKIENFLSQWEENYLDKDIGKYPKNLKKLSAKIDKLIQEFAKALKNYENNEEPLFDFYKSKGNDLSTCIKKIKEGSSFLEKHYAKLNFFLGLGCYAYHSQGLTGQIVFNFEQANLYLDRLHPIERYILMGALYNLYNTMPCQEREKQERRNLYKKKFENYKKEYESDDKKYILDLIDYGSYFYDKKYLVFAYYFYQCAYNHLQNFGKTEKFQKLAWDEKFKLLQVFRYMAYCNFFPVSFSIEKCENTKIIQVIDSIFNISQRKTIAAYSLALWILAPSEIFHEEVVETQYLENVRIMREKEERITVERELVKVAYAFYNAFLRELGNLQNRQETVVKYSNSILELIQNFSLTLQKIQEYYSNVITAILKLLTVTPDVQDLIAQGKMTPLNDYAQLNALERLMGMNEELAKLLELFFRLISVFFEIKEEKSGKISYDINKLKGYLKEKDWPAVEQLILMGNDFQSYRTEMTKAADSWSKNIDALKNELNNRTIQSADDLLEMIEKEKEDNAKKFTETRKKIKDKLPKNFNNLQKPPEKSEKISDTSEPIERKPARAMDVNKENSNPNHLSEEYLENWQKAYAIYLAAKKSNKNVISFFHDIVNKESFPKKNEEMISLFQNIIKKARENVDYLTVCKVSCLAADMLTELARKYFFRSHLSQNANHKLPFTEEIILNTQYLLKKVLELRTTILESMRELQQQHSDEFVSYHASVQITHDYTDKVVNEIYKVIDKFYREQQSIFAAIVERNKCRKTKKRKNKRPLLPNPYKELRQFIHSNEEQQHYIVERTKKIKQEIDVLDQSVQLVWGSSFG